jgi:hypothetical protein
LVAAIALWIPVEPLWSRLVVRAGVPAIHALEREPGVADIDVEGRIAVVRRPPSAAAIGEQRLELSTHHNNVPLLVALMLGASRLPWRRRGVALGVGLAALFATHVAHLVLAVQWEYASRNLRAYEVAAVEAPSHPWLAALHDRSQLRKMIVLVAYEFQAHVGRLVWPIVLWMLLELAFRPRRV